MLRPKGRPILTLEDNGVPGVGTTPGLRTAGSYHLPQFPSTQNQSGCRSGRCYGRGSEGSALVVNLSCSRPRPAVLTTVMGNRDGLGPAGCVCVCGLGGVGLGQTPGSPPSTGVQRWPWAAARVPWLDAVGLGSVISFDATQP